MQRHPAAVGRDAEPLPGPGRQDDGSGVAVVELEPEVAVRRTHGRHDVEGDARDLTVQPHVEQSAPADAFGAGCRRLEHDLVVREIQRERHALQHVERRDPARGERHVAETQLHAVVQAQVHLLARHAAAGARAALRRPELRDERGVEARDAGPEIEEERARAAGDRDRDAPEQALVARVGMRIEAAAGSRSTGPSLHDDAARRKAPVRRRRGGAARGGESRYHVRGDHGSG